MRTYDHDRISTDSTVTVPPASRATVVSSFSPSPPLLVLVTVPFLPLCRTLVPFRGSVLSSSLAPSMASMRCSSPIADVIGIRNCSATSTQLCPPSLVEPSMTRHVFRTRPPRYTLSLPILPKAIPTRPCLSTGTPGTLLIFTGFPAIIRSPLEGCSSPLTICNL